MLRASGKTLLNKLLQLADEELRKKIESLNEEELKVFEYFLTNVSVGTIIALKELSAFYKIKNPKDVILKLIEYGLLEQGTGCYNLAKPIRDLLIKILGLKQ